MIRMILSRCRAGLVAGKRDRAQGREGQALKGCQGTGQVSSTLCSIGVAHSLELAALECRQLAR